MAEASRAGIVLQWEPPRHEGGAPVSGYVVERAQAYSNRFLRLAHLPGAAETTYRDVNVHDGYEYEYRVCAENEAGEGPFSKVLGPVAARDRFGTFSCHIHSPILCFPSKSEFRFCFKTPVTAGPVLGWSLGRPPPVFS